MLTANCLCCLAVCFNGGDAFLRLYTIEQPGQHLLDVNGPPGPFQGGTRLVYRSMSPVIMRQRARLRFISFAAAVAAAAQMLITGAPLAEGRSGPSAVAHVEAAGTSVHYAHDEATCAACVSQHLLATSEASHSGDVAFLASSATPLSAVPRVALFAQRFFSRSRAPPLLVV